MTNAILVSGFFVLLVSCVIANPFWNKFSELEKNGNVLKYRSKRPSQIIDDCMVVGLEEATYFYKSRGEANVCGLYLAATHDQRLEITLESLSSDCETGLVSFLDGWELGGEVFPSPEDAPMDKRVSNFCGTFKKKLFLTASNAATILYKLPTPGDQFKISVRFLRHPKPCNILLMGDPTIITLRNHGLRRNCSVATANPASVKVLQMAIGPDHLMGTPYVEEQMMTMMCHKRDLEDWAVIGGSSGLNNHLMERDQFLCGTLSSRPKLPWAKIICDVTSVRLVSSGMFDNFLTVAVTPLTDLDIVPTTVCPIPSEA